MKRKMIIVLSSLVILSMLAGGVIAVLTIDRTITQTATISAVGDVRIYSDETCTTEMTTYDWGAYVANETKSVDIYIKAVNGNIDQYELTSSATGFVASLDSIWLSGATLEESNFWFQFKDEGVSWIHSQSKSLNVGEVLHLTMELTAGYNPSPETFNFGATITATEVV